MKKINKILILFFIFLPFYYSQAKVFYTPSGMAIISNEPEWKILKKEYILPSGLKYVVEYLVPKVQAQEMTLKEQIVLYIKQMAVKYKVDENMLIKVANCESQLNINAIGDKGKAFGLYQFWLNTFNLFMKEARFDFDYKNWRHQSELAAWAFSKGYGYHWVCAKRLGFIK